MKLVTTSLAVGALVMSLSGAALAQTSLDPAAQGTRGTVGAPPSSGVKAGGAATTGAGLEKPGAKAGAQGTVSGKGSAGGPVDKNSQGPDAGAGAAGKARGGLLGN